MASCDECTFCCRILGVPELAKPMGSPCNHCGQGCQIYERRPTSCRNFECAWLQAQVRGIHLDKSLRPDLCGVVVFQPPRVNELIVLVDPDRKDAWRVGRIHEMILNASRKGVRVLVGTPNSSECYEINNGVIKQIEGHYVSDAG